MYLGCSTTFVKAAFCLLEPALTEHSLVAYLDRPIYYIHINDSTLELSVFWPSDTES